MTNSDTKAIFFDIDGTLWNYKNEIPESTVRAISLLRQNGHIVFINSGRCRGFIQNEDLLALGFDGIVSGCGTMIEYGGEMIYFHDLECETLAEDIRILKECNFSTILEGRRFLYMDKEEFADDAYGRKVIAEMGESLRSISGSWMQWEASKFSCDCKRATEEQKQRCVKALEDRYDIFIHTSNVYEMVPKGFNKATGIERVCEKLGIDLKNTVAFGDGINDIDMLKKAHIGVAMGNGAYKAKDAADYVTTALFEDGVYNACVHLGLI